MNTDKEKIIRTENLLSTDEHRYTQIKKNNRRTLRRTESGEPLLTQNIPLIPSFIRVHPWTFSDFDFDFDDLTP
jgi:hypothetical protein